MNSTSGAASIPCYTNDDVKPRALSLPLVRTRLPLWAKCMLAGFEPFWQSFTARHVLESLVLLVPTAFFCYVSNVTPTVFGLWMGAACTLLLALFLKSSLTLGRMRYGDALSQAGETFLSHYAIANGALEDLSSDDMAILQKELPADLTFSHLNRIFIYTAITQDGPRLHTTVDWDRRDPDTTPALKGIVLDHNALVGLNAVCESHGLPAGFLLNPCSLTWKATPQHGWIFPALSNATAHDRLLARAAYDAQCGRSSTRQQH